MTNNGVWTKAYRKVMLQPVLPNGTRELLNVYLKFNPEGKIKRAKDSYIEAELAWYKSMDKRIVNHPVIGTNPVWQKCATKEGHTNSNYGWCIWSEDNCKQYENAVDHLLKDAYSRQSCCIYTRPSIQYEHADEIHAHYDYICTFCTQHFIRDGKLEYIVYMRSNDIEYGLPYDLAWHQHVYKNMLEDLNAMGRTCDKGNIHWHASSLHKYEKR